MQERRRVDNQDMDGESRRLGVDAPNAAGALESLERLLGEHWGRAMWMDACRRAGVPSRSTGSPEDLRRVARELTEVPGPAGVFGRTLNSQVTLYESLRRTGSAERD